MLSEIALQDHSKEFGTSDNEYSNEADERDHGNRLNRIYQGSLRESGSTLQPRSNSANGQRLWVKNFRVDIFALLSLDILLLHVLLRA